MAKVMKNLWICFVVCALLGCFSVEFARASEDAQAEESFVQFQKEWIQKLREHGKYGEEHAQVTEDGEKTGTYLAEYSVLTEPSSFEIKKTDVSASPYVGVIHYEKQTYSCRAKSPEEAKRGPYQLTKSSGVTEIFRYSKGKWLY
jgi:hypothetical protein